MVSFSQLLGVFITDMLVPSTDSALLENVENAAQSPCVIALTRAGIKILPSVINAGILTSAFSAGNSLLFYSSRILYGLSIRGQAPKIFSYCTKSGLPLAAVLFSSCFSILSFMNTQSSSEQVFK